jgi:hypothetical protein
MLNYFLLRFTVFTDEDTLPTLIGLVEAGIAMARQASKSIDPSLRLEKFLALIVCLLLHNSPLNNSSCISTRAVASSTAFSTYGKQQLNMQSRTIRYG